jgi:ribosomal protein S27E
MKALAGHRVRGGATRQVVLLLLAGALLVLAGASYWWMSRPEAAPSGEFVAFHCLKCGRTFQLSHAQLDKLWEKHELRTGSDGHVLVKCEKCEEFTAGRAEEPATGER